MDEEREDELAQDVYLEVHGSWVVRIRVISLLYF